MVIKINMYSVLFIFFVITVLVHGASLRQGVVPVITCETKECHDAAEQITKWMNPSFKPCQDFYEFSCGYWHNPNDKTENKKHNMSLGSREDFFNLHLKTFILDDSLDKESNLFKMLKEFINLCLDEDSIDARGVSPAVQFLRKAGGWPVLEKDWSEHNFDLLKAEIATGGVIIKFDLQPIGADDLWTLIISPKYNSEEIFKDLADGFEKDSVKEYYKKKCDMAVAYGAERSKAEKEMRGTLDFEIAMSQLEKQMNDSDNLEIYNMSQLNSEISWVDWTPLLTSLLPQNVPLKENLTFYTVSPKYINELGIFFNKYPKRAIANYMMSKAAIPLSKLLPAKVSNISGYNTDSRFDTCASILKSSSLKGIFASYLARQTLEDTTVATDMTQHLLDELIIQIKNLGWLDEDTRSDAIKTLQDTTLHISFPDELLNMDTVQDVYKQVKVNTSYFFEAMMDSKKWVKEEKFKKIGTSIGDQSLSHQIDTALTINAYFMTGVNHIVVSAGFLHFLPLFSYEMPAYVNYGHLGGIIAHELTHALDFQTDVGELRNLGQLLFRWGSNETEEIYDEKKQCFIDQYSSFNDTKYTGMKLNGEQTKREDIADNGGMRLALHAYRRMASQLKAPEPKLPNLQHYSNEQMFMISLANAYCAIPTKEELIMQMASDSHSPFEFRLKGMMMNSPEFSKFFDCKDDDPMNPKKKCEVW